MIASRLALALAAAALVAGPALAQTAPPPADAAQRLLELEQQVRFLTEEVTRLRAASGTAAAAAPVADPRTDELEKKVDALAEEVTRTSGGFSLGKPLDSHWGLGPAASKVYGVEHGVSLGGYGEILWQGVDSTRDDGSRSTRKDELDALRVILYAGYKFTDRILFNSEIEFEHANTGADGQVEVEFANVDFLVNDAFNVRAGMMLVPVGFTNEMHEPTTFWSARRPAVETSIIPTTWAENGFGVFGEKGPFSYRAYVMAGLDASGFSASNGIRGGRQKGSRSLAEDLAFVARFDVEPAPGLDLGGSVFWGGAGQDAKVDGEEISADVTLWEAHLAYQWRGLGFRALYAEGDIDEAEKVNELLGLSGDDSVGARLSGWYAELGYDVLSHLDGDDELIPFVRYESFDTQASVPDGFLRDPANEREILTWGVAYKPHPQVVIKLDWQDVDNGAGTGNDQFNAAVGYSF